MFCLLGPTHWSLYILRPLFPHFGQKRYSRICSVFGEEAEDGVKCDRAGHQAPGPGGIAPQFGFVLSKAPLRQGFVCKEFIW